MYAFVYGVVLYHVLFLYVYIVILYTNNSFCVAQWCPCAGLSPCAPPPPCSITDQELQPLRMQLSELEARIVEQVGGTT